MNVQKMLLEAAPALREPLERFYNLDVTGPMHMDVASETGLYLAGGGIGLAFVGGRLLLKKRRGGSRRGGGLFARAGGGASSQGGRADTSDREEAEAAADVARREAEEEERCRREAEEATQVEALQEAREAEMRRGEEALREAEETFLAEAEEREDAQAGDSESREEEMLEQAFTADLEHLGMVARIDNNLDPYGPRPQSSRRRQEKNWKEHLDWQQGKGTRHGLDTRLKAYAHGADPRLISHLAHILGADKKGETAFLSEVEKNQDAYERLSSLIHVLIDMVNEGYADERIAFTMVRRAENAVPGEDLFQTVEAVRAFVEQCGAGRGGGSRHFQEAGRERMEPEWARTLDNVMDRLAAGDPIGVTEVLHEEAQDLADQARRVQNAAVREEMLSRAARLESYGGTLAARYDPAQAMEFYQSALEMDPRSVNASSRLGDLCLTHGDTATAERAYEQVLAFAEPEQEVRLIANADLKLADIFEARENPDLAGQLRAEGRARMEEAGLVAPESPDQQIEAAAMRRHLREHARSDRSRVRGEGEG